MSLSTYSGPYCTYGYVILPKEMIWQQWLWTLVFRYNSQAKIFFYFDITKPAARDATSGSPSRDHWKETDDPGKSTQL